MDESKEPGILINNIILKELNFSRGPNTSPSPQLIVNFQINRTIFQDKKMLNLEMVCTLNNEQEMFNLKCIMIGIFSQIPGKENMTLEQFSETNAPAIIIPYIREIISSTTLKAGMAPIIIAPINVISMVKNSTEIKVES